MLTITYECQTVPNDTPTTVYYRGFFTARGATPEEVFADRDRHIARLHAFNVMAIGLHNRRRDWEAVFGPEPDMPNTAFYDPELERQAILVAQTAHRSWLWEFWPNGAFHPSRYP